MGKIVSAISALGKKQIGYAESPLGSNRTKYGNLWDTPKSKGGPYPFFNGKKNGQCGWCCLYVLWEIAMVLKDILGWTYDQIRVWLGMPKNPADNCGAGCPWLYKYFKAKKWEVDKKKGVQGDIIFFNTSAGKCTHVGRIESVLSGGKYKYIGGNQSNKVSYKTISMTSSNLYAVIHIPYETIEPKEEAPVEQTPVKPEPITPVYPKYKVHTVTGDWLALRIAPNTKGVLVSRMPQGSDVELLNTVKGEKVYGSNEWALVKYLKTSQCGYCIKSRLKKA